MNQKTSLIILIILALGGLYLRNAPFTNGNLDTDAPPLRTSYDVFANTEHIKWIADSEQSYYLAPARTGGLNAINAQNPLYYLMIATFTKLTKTNAYQNTYLVLNLLSIFIILTVFIIIEKTFGTPTALVTSALGFFLYPHWLFPMYIGFQYDYHTYHLLAGIFFLLIYLFCWTKKTYKEDLLIYTLIGILLTAITLSHYSETFFFTPLIALLLTAHLYFSRTHSLGKKTILFCIPFTITLLYFAYFYPLTLNVHLAGGFGGQLTNQINPERAKHLDYFPWPRFNTTLNLLSLLGITTLAMMSITKKIDKKRALLLIFIAYILFAGTSNYTLNVWANRAERQLFLGHSFFVLLPALGIIGMTTLLSKNNKKIITLATLASIILIPSTIYSDTYKELNNIATHTAFDDDKWNAIQWIRDNTPTNARFFFMSGYIHEFQMLAERIELKGDLNLGHTQENILKICKKEWPETVSGEWGFRDPPSAGFITKRTGWNSFERALPFQNTTHPFINMSMVRDNAPLNFFHYIVLEHKGNQFDPCSQWFINEAQHKNYTIAYQNSKMTILKFLSSQAHSENFEGEQ